MWKQLPLGQKEEYKKMILAFASLSEMFAQKAEGKEDIYPFINSKYQETVFQRVFDGAVEDKANTPYDMSLITKKSDGKLNSKFLIGIKTFRYSSDKQQKIEQFKSHNKEWSNIVNKINSNAKNCKTREEINKKNEQLYLQLARKIADCRNKVIKSARANLIGFSYDDTVECVYHVLIPAVKKHKPYIYVGEFSFDTIDKENITILGSTKPETPQNFTFTDNKHTYKYTSADSQLYMEFKTKSFKEEDKWDVEYTENPYQVFSNIADKLLKKQTLIEESYSWLLSINLVIPLNLTKFKESFSCL